jgi:L-serine deaminase
MSDPVELAIIAGLVGLVPSILAYLNGRQQSANHKETMDSQQRATDDIQVLKRQTDGISTALNVAVKGEAGAIGELKGRADARADAKEDAKL